MIVRIKKISKSVDKKKHMELIIVADICDLIEIIMFWQFVVYNFLKSEQNCNIYTKTYSHMAIIFLYNFKIVRIII